MGILALVAELENDIRRERQMDAIKKAQERGCGRPSYRRRRCIGPFQHRRLHKVATRPARSFWHCKADFEGRAQLHVNWVNSVHGDNRRLAEMPQVTERP
jgi:hypothetical protein